MAFRRPPPPSNEGLRLEPHPSASPSSAQVRLRAEAGRPRRTPAARNPRPSPLPPGLGVEIDRAVRLFDEGTVLVGGCPPRAVRLTTDQASALIRWSSGASPAGRAERLLARRLVDSGLAHPRPERDAVPVEPGTVEVAVVGQAGSAGLARTLDDLAADHPALRPVVVGATGACAWVARARGARVVPGPPGGAEARAAALDACSAPLLALLVAGARPGPGWLETALGHFADPGVAAVLPRVLTARPNAPSYGEMTIAAVAADRAGADRGADPAPVLPWGRGTGGPGLPGTANEHTGADPLNPVNTLVLRRAAVGRLDPGPGAGAETDALWRLAEDGWSVRYEPRSRVWNPPVTDLGGYLRACFARGAAAGPLARSRHTRAAGPDLPWPSAVGLALVAAGHPALAAGAVALGAADTAWRLSRVSPGTLPEALRLAARDLAHTARVGGRWVRGTWWPVLAAVAVGAGAVAFRGPGPGTGPTPVSRTVSPSSSSDAGLRTLRAAGPSGRARWIAAAAGAVLTLPHLGAWHRGRGVALVDPVGWTALAVAGDAARALGAWWGVARSGSSAPLTPGVRAVAVRPSAGRSGGAPNMKEKSLSLVSSR
ncbi:family 2 glycosyl transferase [Nocardiopsis sp. NPDC050513]|uniref:family 2 glycosyl transferase n=1 Tax=Nocardiopsis sp. NPDC050513 TaxID=3364338 RepID=UPI0037B86966